MSGDLDMETYQPPADDRFRELLIGAVQGDVPVYGVVLELDKVKLRRFDDSHHPELMPQGQKIVQAMAQAWNDGRPAQPWLYVDGDTYVVADNYFWLALVEQGRPAYFPAQVMGEPLEEGLQDKVALDAATVRAMLGLAEGPAPEGGEGTA